MNRQQTVVPGVLEKPAQIANGARETEESSSFSVKLDSSCGLESHIAV